VWDRLFGTFREMKTSDIQFGLDVYQGYSTTRFFDLIKFPFVKRNKQK